MVQSSNKEGSVLEKRVLILARGRVNLQMVPLASVEVMPACPGNGIGDRTMYSTAKVLNGID